MAGSSAAHFGERGAYASCGPTARLASAERRPDWCGWLLAVLLWLPGLPALALGLGGLEVRSALNEPLRATIALRDVGELSERQVLVNLAPAEAFERLGMDRSLALSMLEFEADFSNASAPRIQVSSDRPVREPFLNFVIEVRWPEGRLQRDYTALLDPPGYRAGGQSLPVDDQPGPAPPPVATQERSEPSVSGPATTAVEDDRGEAGATDDGLTEYTDGDDTLWSIAAAVRPASSVSVQQTMLALYRLNPDAFVDGNINLLRAGYRLRIPDLEEIQRQPQNDAIAEVEDHNASWQARRDGGSGALRLVVDAPEAGADADAGTDDLTDTAAAEQSDTATPATSQTPAESEAGQPEASSTEAIAELRERLEAAEAARAESRDELAGVRQALEGMGRQLELQQQQLARLQRELSHRAGAAGEGLPVPLPLLAGAGLALLLLVLVWIIWRRRLQAGPGDDQAAGVNSARAENSELRPALQGDASSPSAGMPDALAEAEVAMAYGRFSEAMRVLRAGLEANPERTELRLKLLEVLAEAGDEAAFNAECEALGDELYGDTAAQVARLSDRLHGAEVSSARAAAPAAAARPAAEGRDPEPAEALETAAPLGAEAASAVEQQAAAPEGDHNTSHEAESASSTPGPDLTSLDIDLDVEPDADLEPEEPPRQPTPDDSGAADIGDFDFDLDLLPADVATDEPTVPAEETPPAGATTIAEASDVAEPEVADADTLELDLDLDALESAASDGAGQTAEQDPAAVRDPAPADRSDDDDLGLDLDLDLDALTTDGQTRPEEPSGQAQADRDGAAALETGADAPLPTPEVSEETVLPVDYASEPLPSSGEDDPLQSRLELGEAFLNAGDLDSAREYLQAVAREGSPEQARAARALLKRELGD